VVIMLLPVSLRAEAIDDTFTQITPTHMPSTGEFVHGQGYGKVLMRIMFFGAVPSQGIHYVPEGTDLLFAMLYAGGYTDSTKLAGITIRRRNVKNLIEVDLEDLLDEGRSVPKLIDGDVVNVPFNWRRDMAMITMITGFISAMTGFTLSIVSLSRNR